jgi:hypothetical protein
MSLIFATQLTAVATLALAVFALAAAVLALLAWRKQSAEVRDQAKMLELQSAEVKVLALTRQRELLAERSAQAELVFLTTTWDSSEEELTGHVRNTSQQPVYDLMFHHPDPDKNTFEPLPLLPGHELSHRYGRYSPLTLQIMPRQQLPSVTFRDRAGIRWETWPDGQLSDLGEQPEMRPTEPWGPMVNVQQWIEGSLSQETAPNEDGGSSGTPPGPAPGRT